MKGWKTWVAAIAVGILGVIDIVNGDLPAGIEKIAGGLALVGIGHKIEKGLSL